MYREVFQKKKRYDLSKKHDVFETHTFESIRFSFFRFGYQEIFDILAEYATASNQLRAASF